jgi:serine/threonine-protein kinase
MDATRWERLQDVFHGATSLDEAARLAFVERECGVDVSLRADVLSMLAEDARGHPLLDRDIGLVASDLLGGGEGGAKVPAEKFGHYRVRRVLGEGGMGVVYLAERDDLGSLAAIKILRDACGLRTSSAHSRSSIIPRSRGCTTPMRWRTERRGS